MTAGIVATALVFWPAAPLFLLIHGKDITIPKGTEVPTFVDGNMPLDFAKFQQAASPAEQTQSTPTPSGVLPSESQANGEAGIEITSLPAGAEVELDGSFIGNTPSTVGVSPGDHTISVRKKGYKTWERKIKVSSGKVSVLAELEAEVSQIPSGTSATTSP